MSQRSEIKLFRNGCYCGTRSIEAVQRLYAGGHVSIEHNKKGFIVAAHERPGISKNLPAGTSYIYEERPEILYDLKRLDGRRSGIEYAPDEMRIEFLRVVESVRSG